MNECHRQNSNPRQDIQSCRRTSYIPSIKSDQIVWNRSKLRPQRRTTAQHMYMWMKNYGLWIARQQITGSERLCFGNLSVLCSDLFFFATSGRGRKERRRRREKKRQLNRIRYLSSLTQTMAVNLI